MTNYTNLIEQLHKQADEIANAGHAGWGNASMDAADAIEALMKERDHYKAMYVSAVEELADVTKELKAESAQATRFCEELAALRKQIDELQPGAWRYHGSDGYWRLEHPHHCEVIETEALYSLEGIKK